MKKYNLIVVGGGLSGCGAAIAAAREGLSVLLVEKSGCLGGAISNNLVYPFMRFWEKQEQGEERKYLSTGIFTEMREAAAAIEGHPSTTTFKPESFKRALDKMLIEANVEILFHTTLCGVNVLKDQITSVRVLTKTGLTDIQADYFVDATGDGDLLYCAGCDFQLGRESDGLCQPMTTCFRLSNVDIELFNQERPILQELYKQAQEKGNIKNPRENILAFTGIGDGILHLNTTRVIKCDPTNPFELSQAEIFGREQVYEMFEFLKKNSKACENCTVISIANEIGVRESRKLKGLHILTTEELKDCVYFEDTIARGAYEIDIHNPSGTGTQLYYFKKGEVYQIPYRSLVPKEYINMLVAGRCLSATHEAHSAVRIMPICACLGQAAGTAIAIAYNTGTNTHTVSIPILRETLRKNGANV